MCEYKTFYNMVKKWTISDYRTQKIKAEVIIDMLISEYIEEIVSHSLGKNIKLIAKEFPIARIGQPNVENKEDPSSNRQYASVDFIMSDKESETPVIYLVELKTSNDSMDGLQLWNMLWTCNQGSNSLYNRFYDIIMNHGINGKHGNKLSTKKYQYTLGKYAIKNGKDLSGNLTIFGSKRTGKKSVNVKSAQEKTAQTILEKGFFQDFNGAEMQILYVSPNAISKKKLTDLADSAKKDIQKDLPKKKMNDNDKKDLMNFLESDISSFVADEHISLKKLRGFDDKLGCWPLISEILDKLQDDWQNWFDEKELCGDEQ